MSKEARGNKHICDSCGARFYDLNKNPPVCPVCKTAAVVAKPEPAVAPEAPEEEEAVAAEPAAAAKDAPEFVSLEDADAEQGVATEDDIDEEELVDLGEEEADLPAAEEDDTFLEEDDEGGADVTDIVPGTLKTEEES